MKHHKKWTDEELEILRRVYPHEGYDGVRRYLNGRTKSEIQHAAQSRGIRLTPDAYAQIQAKARARGIEARCSKAWTQTQEYRDCIAMNKFLQKRWV